MDGWFPTVGAACCPPAVAGIWLATGRLCGSVARALCRSFEGCTFFLIPRTVIALWGIGAAVTLFAGLMIIRYTVLSSHR